MGQQDKSTRESDSRRDESQTRPDAFVVLLEVNSSPIRFDRLISQSQIIYRNRLIVEQILPRAVR